MVYLHVWYHQDINRFVVIIFTECPLSCLQDRAVNSLASCEIWMGFLLSNCQAKLSYWWLMHHLRNCLLMNINGWPYWWWLNIDSGNGVVTSNNKTLPEPKIYVAIMLHWATGSEVEYEQNIMYPIKHARYWVYIIFLCHILSHQWTHKSMIQ